MNRNSLIVGPALCTFNGAKWFTQSDIAVAMDQETFNIETSPHGKIDERAKEFKAEAAFTPAGQWTQAFLDAVWNAYANMVIGTDVFTPVDLPFVMSGANNGEVHTFIAAAVTKLPDILLGATKTMIGPMTITGLRGLIGTAWSVDSAAYTVAGTGGSIADSAFAPASIITQPYTGIWSTEAGFTVAVETELGWTVSFNLSLEPRAVDSLGVITMKFKSIECMVKCVPIGPTAANLLSGLKIQGAGAVRGRSFASGATQLQITGADGVHYFTIPAAAMKTAGYRFGATVLRNNEIGFVAARTFTAGVQNALYTLAGGT